MQRFFNFLLVFGAALSLFGIFLSFKQEPLNPYIVQNANTYLGPQQRLPGNPQLIRVQVLISDDPSPQGVQMMEVEFNGQTIPLKPRDIYGFRGQASFQLPPDKYKLRWKVRVDRVIWPRTLTHEEEVTLSPRDLWIQINISGNQATIS